MMDAPLDLNVTDEELELLFQPQPATGLELGGFDMTEDVAPSPELQEVSRRIAGQYVELIEAFAASLFQRRAGSNLTPQLLRALEALSRLARASNDPEASAAVDELLEELHIFMARQAQGRGADRMATRLRAWIPRFAALLEPDAKERLLSLVSFRGRTIPLFHALGSIPGIGPRRLERLYCAGLYTIESVVNSDPDEVAQVTGLPPKLAERVVEATRTFAAEDRLRSARELSARATEVLTLLKTGAQDPEILALTRDALRALQAALNLRQDTVKP